MALPSEIRRILVPVNGDTGDERAIDLVAQLAAKTPISLTLIYVVEVLQSMPLDAELPSEIDKGEHVLHSAESLARQYQTRGAKLDRISTELLQARSAGAAIVDEAMERGSDQIVMAAEIRRKHGRTTSGETVGYVIKNAPCEVLVMRLTPSEQVLRGAWSA